MSQKIILDASFFLSYLLPDEEQADKEVFQKIIGGQATLLEPYLFCLEVLNGLLSAHKSKRISASELKNLVSKFAKLGNIEYSFQINQNKVVDLALKNRLSIYDAVYLHLKEETGCPLYSLDEKLLKLAKDKL